MGDLEYSRPRRQRGRVIETEVKQVKWTGIHLTDSDVFPVTSWIQDSLKPTFYLLDR